MSFDSLRRKCEPALRRVLHTYWRFSRGATLGVRAMVMDAQGRVFLIRHSYVDGWHMPGGGVETGESLIEALTRELREEGNIELASTPALHGIYFNSRVSRRDHVALFIVRDFRQGVPPRPGREIVAHGFFARNELPEGTTRATHARLAEVLDGVATSEIW
ncbi:MAG TPA: NUDIX domain-containing protein [Pseudolabrys sp.]|nr:NUDIX domain-containing protein [Pseudolabrys sp.]